MISVASLGTIPGPTISTPPQLCLLNLGYPPLPSFTSSPPCGFFLSHPGVDPVGTPDETFAVEGLGWVQQVTGESPAALPWALASQEGECTTPRNGHRPRGTPNRKENPYKKRQPATRITKERWFYLLCSKAKCPNVSRVIYTKPRSSGRGVGTPPPVKSLIQGIGLLPFPPKSLTMLHKGRQAGPSPSSQH